MLLKHNRFPPSGRLEQISSVLYPLPAFLSNNHPVATSASTNSADLTNLADGTAVLGQVLRAVEGTGDGWLTARVYGGVAGTADGELSERVELDVNCVGGLALVNGLEFAGLEDIG